MSSRPAPRAGIFELQPLEIRRFLTTAVVNASNVLVVTGTSAADAIAVTATGTGRTVVTGVIGSDGLQRRFDFGTLVGQYTRIQIDGLGGNDNLSIANPVTYSGSTIFGSAGNDTITGGQGKDTIQGGLGNDTLDGRGNADVLDGDDNFDTVNYSARTSGVKVALNGLADDGVVG